MGYRGTIKEKSTINNFFRVKMVIKVDKSEEFKKTGRKLISEYDGHEYYDEKEEEKPQFLNENSTIT